MKILPLRNMVLVRFQDEDSTLPSGLVHIRDPRSVRMACILACGPDVHDLQPDMVVLVNSVAGSVIGEQLLVPDSAVLGTL